MANPLAEFRLIRRLDHASIDLTSDEVARLMVGLLARLAEGDLPVYREMNSLELYERLRSFYLPTVEVSIWRRMSNFWRWMGHKDG